MRLTEAPNQLHPSLPPKPDFAQKADALGLGASQQTPEEAALVSSASRALAGTTRDVVANRAAIRMANMNAAEMLKAEMAGLVPVKQSKSAVRSSSNAIPPTETSEDPPSEEPAPAPQDVVMTNPIDTPAAQALSIDGMCWIFTQLHRHVSHNHIADAPASDSNVPVGHKRSHEEVEAEDAAIGEDPNAVTIVPEGDEDSDAPVDQTDLTLAKMKVQGDGSVEQEDKVKLYEPGYRERYYRQKFGFEASDEEAKRK